MNNKKVNRYRRRCYIYIPVVSLRRERRKQLIIVRRKGEMYEFKTIIIFMNLIQKNRRNSERNRKK